MHLRDDTIDLEFDDDELTGFAELGTFLADDVGGQCGQSTAL
jgi:hypothetical protein